MQKIIQILLLLLAAFLIVTLVIINMPYHNKPSDKVVTLAELVNQAKSGTLNELIVGLDGSVVAVLASDDRVQLAEPLAEDVYMLLLNEGVTNEQMNKISFVADESGRWDEIVFKAPIIGVTWTLTVALWILVLILLLYQLLTGNRPPIIKALWAIFLVVVPLIGTFIYWFVDSQKSVKARRSPK